MQVTSHRSTSSDFCPCHHLETGHKLFPGSSCSQMSLGSTGNGSIFLHGFSATQSTALPKPQTRCLERSAQTEHWGKLFPQLLCLQHLHFLFKSSRFLPVLLNLEITSKGASQTAASTNISVHRFLPSLWGFPPHPGPARVTVNQENPSNAWAQVELGSDFGLGLCHRMNFSQEYLQKTNTLKARPCRKGNHFKIQRLRAALCFHAVIPQIQLQP